MGTGSRSPLVNVPDRIWEMSNNINEFARILGDVANRNGKTNAQVIWARCTSLDWEAKTMEAESVSEGVRYYDVILGNGFTYVRPRIGSLCLIGLIGGERFETFLMDADEVDEVEMKASGVNISTDGTKIEIRNGDHSLKTLIDALFERINEMVFTTNVGPTIKLVNAPQFQQLKERFGELLK